MFFLFETFTFYVFYFYVFPTNIVFKYENVFSNNLLSVFMKSTCLLIYLTIRQISLPESFKVAFT